MTITLIGYRGSGKTSVAGLLARRLGCDWIDADAELQRRAGRSIREIFADAGEAHFRRLEKELLAELLTQDKLVIAAGGGAVLNDDTRRLMREAGPVVWLRASVETLAGRIAGDPGTDEQRPNLTGVGGREEIAQLLIHREPFYRDLATHVVETDGLTVDDVVERVAAALAADANGGR